MRTGNGTSADSAPAGIASGPDGTMWFTTRGSSQVGWISTGRRAGLTTVVKGTPEVGSQVSCRGWLTAPWQVDRMRYSWFRDGERIARASGSDYTLTSADEGTRLRCRISLTFSPSQLQWADTSRAVRVRQG